jgi:hypothetical protein
MLGANPGQAHILYVLEIMEVTCVREGATRMKGGSTKTSWSPFVDAEPRWTDSPAAH